MPAPTLGPVSTEPSSRLGKVVATWGIAQIALLLGSAVYRLTPLAIEPWRDGTLTSPQKLLFVGWIIANGYMEGYRGFQRRFCPRVVGRARELATAPTLVRTVLALPFCMSLFDAPRRQMIVQWIFLVALATLIAFVKTLPQPWRGIIDGGVVVGLVWGLVMTLVYFVRYLSSGEVPAVEERRSSATTVAAT